jgi:transcriptional regulator with XRE-family HTH domain
MEQNHLRRSDVARLAGLSPSIITRVLNGAQEPTGRTMTKILAALGASDQTFSSNTPIPKVIEVWNVDSNPAFTMCRTLQIIGGYFSIEEALEDAIRVQLTKKEKANAPHHDS